MFNYTKEVIINSLTIDQDAYGSGQEAQKFQATPGVLHILREGEYRVENILDKRIFKTPGIVGQTAKITLNIANGGGTIFDNEGVYRISISIGMNNRFLADYAHANWYPFAKPMIAEFEVTAANNTVAQMNLVIQRALNDVINYNNIFARVSIVGSVIEIDLTSAHAHVNNVILEYYDPTSCDSCLGDFAPLNLTDPNLIVVQNTEPFATGKWIQENLRFPSYPNVRYAGLYSDERPIMGQLYTQYSFAMIAKRTELGGLSGVGQEVTSITRHVYYVLNTLVDAFEQIVRDGLGPNIIVEKNSVIIISTNTVANDDVTIRLKADTYPIDETAVITWSIVDASGNPTSAPTGVTLTSTGELTASPSATDGTTFYVKAASSNTEFKPAIRQFTVIQG